MKEYELAIVGAGPAGLSAAAEATKAGVREVVVIDEQVKPGGQLIKQTHKFFGGTEHKARMRGIDIASQLARECSSLELRLNTVVWGIFDHTLWLYSNGEVEELESKKILLATGAMENPLAFPGWTLPGVMGAGALQTVVNVWRVLPARKVLMVGSGNIGLIVSYQLMQAGMKVVAVVEALPRIGGYRVHASKVARLGIPILTSHTLKEAKGNNKVEVATVCRVDSNYQPIPGTEQDFETDIICIATGLSPLTELARMSGCEFMYIPELGGHIPVRDENMELTVPGIYVAGDIAGIEEASTAMVQGAIVGLAVAESLGYLSKQKFEQLKQAKLKSQEIFEKGRFESRRVARQKLQERVKSV